MGEAVKAIDNENAVARLMDSLEMYRKESGFHGYSDETLLHDLLYFVGLSLDQGYKWAEGYDKFKQRLREHLGEPEQ